MEGVESNEEKAHRNRDSTCNFYVHPLFGGVAVLSFPAERGLSLDEPGHVAQGNLLAAAFPQRASRLPPVRKLVERNGVHTAFDAGGKRCENRAIPFCDAHRVGCLPGSPDQPCPANGWPFCACDRPAGHLSMDDVRARRVAPAASLSFGYANLFI